MAMPTLLSHVPLPLIFWFQSRREVHTSPGGTRLCFKGCTCPKAPFSDESGLSGFSRVLSSLLCICLEGLQAAWTRIHARAPNAGMFSQALSMLMPCSASQNTVVKPLPTTQLAKGWSISDLEPLSKSHRADGTHEAKIDPGF